MAELNLPNIREGGNIRFRIGLEDGGVAVDWSGLEDIRVFLYADAQKQVSGEMCEVAVDEEDNTVLKCKYSGDDVQYRGINSVLVRAKYLGEIKVYDKPAINIVARTSDATGVVEIDDPVVPVQISVEDVSTSLLNNAIDAAINAAAEAEKAAHLVPLQVLEDCVEATGKALEAASKAPYIDETTGNWFVWDAEAGEYVDSGKTARGATGNGIASWSVVESQEDAGNNVVTVTFTDGTSESFNVKNGHTGNGIASIVQTVESPDDAGTNVITITMTNGTVVTFNVKNGSKGTPGVAQAAYKSVSSLPTASAQTMDKIYLTPSGASGVYNMSYTEFDGSAYSWQDLGTTAIQLSDYATKAELDQLEAEVNEKADQAELSQLQQEVTDLTRENYDVDFSIADENGMAIVQLKNGHIITKNFDSKELKEELSEMVKNSDKDFAIGDGNHDIVQFSGGHIKTKNFDSENAPKVEDSTSDFAIADENNNDIVRFKNGHIQTKFFNSENATGGVSTPLSGKVLCTAGDSITRGHGVNPEKFLPTNDPYYPAAGSEPDSNAPTYGYLIAKDNKMGKWYNMGISGSTLGDVFAMGVDHNGFSKQNGRYTQLPADIDYLTIWFGWNDRAYGATMRKEMYLENEYGTYIKYPDNDPSFIGQPGWATQEQVDEINAIGNWNYWLAQYTGTINDNTNKTYCGALNIVLKYLLQERPTLKILIICGWDYYIEESKEIAKKYGVGFINIRDAGNVVSWAATDGIDNSVLFTFDPSIYTTHPEYYRKPEYIPLAGNYTQSEYKRNLLTSDGTHPNEKGYEFIYPRINDKLLKL